MSRQPSEHAIQNAGRNALVDDGLYFRANVGTAWTGDAQKLPDGSILIRNPRRFSTGLPAGFSDTFGLTREIITPDMVGTVNARFTAIEYKAGKGKPKPEQVNFANAIKANGGRAGFAWSVADALEIVRGAL